MNLLSGIMSPPCQRSRKCLGSYLIGDLGTPDVQIGVAFPELGLNAASGSKGGADLLFGRAQQQPGASSFDPRMERVIPVAVEGIPLEIEEAHIDLGYPLADRIRALIQRGANEEAAAGGWDDHPKHLRTSCRAGNDPNVGYVNIGVRCA